MGLAIGVAIVVGLIALAVAAGGVLVLLFVAILLASALEPMVGHIRDRFPLGRGATILVVYATFFVTVVGLAFIVVPKAISQGQEIIASLPAFLDSVRSWASTLRPAILATVGHRARRLGREHPLPVDDAGSQPGGRGRRRGGRGGGLARDAAHDRLLLAGPARPAAALHPRLHPGRTARRRARCLERDRDAARPVGSRPADPDGHDGRWRPASPTPCSGCPGRCCSR